MKISKIFLVFLAGVILFWAPLLSAAELESPGTALRKLQRGFVNTALSPWELAHQLSLNKTDDRAVPTWLTGSFKGIAYTAGRASAGVLEMITFGLPWPAAGYEPLLQPEFPWQHFDSKPAE
ncbi:MAG: exosortase system-associated protein, TIGR04073 family [Candidatus Omnitrophica bacterium]|nr:exosortase system-associated protein, TIGR04073 family [Candidatus Omnitrophota bacterium]